jgi:hypothetical protein
MEHKTPTAGHGEIHALRQEGSGQLFAYTDELASRLDMKPYIGPALSSQPADSVQSQATILANASESQRKVQQLLSEAQGHLDQANHRSQLERQSFEAGLHPLQDENEQLRKRIADLEGAAALEGVAAVTPEALAFSIPEGVNAASIEVVAHTENPVLHPVPHQVPAQELPGAAEAPIVPQPAVSAPTAQLVPPVPLAPPSATVLAASEVASQLS